LLEVYTFEELLFEYIDVTHDRVKDAATTESAKEVPQEERTWAEEEEAKEIAAAIAADAVWATKEATLENDTIVEEAVGISDDSWAQKHHADSRVLTNPTANEIDSEDGDISATFEG